MPLNISSNKLWTVQRPNAIDDGAAVHGPFRGSPALLPFARTINSEAAMNDHSPLRGPIVQRFVQDFDALADLMETRMDWECGDAPHDTIPAAEMEYTTEWQMEPSA